MQVPFPPCQTCFTLFVNCARNTYSTDLGVQSVDHHQRETLLARVEGLCFRGLYCTAGVGGVQQPIAAGRVLGRQRSCVQD